MLPSRFTKMAGGGNDFLLFEADGSDLPAEDRRRVSLLCRRGLSVGADGALFLSARRGAALRLDYFNADGGTASFCANGTRCAARYAAAHGLASNVPVLETGWTTIRASVDDRGDVTLRLPPLPPPEKPVRVSGEGLPAVATPMRVGVPHLVVFIEGDLAGVEVARVAPPLRRHPELPEGANVNFVSVLGRDRIAVRTFERGVEGETLACGSGVVAAAAVASSEGRIDASVACETKSGVVFRVALSRNGAAICEASLTGDARELFTGELEEEAFRE